MKKIKVTLHKNELEKYLVEPGVYTLGAEKMHRWVDIPEYIVVEAVEGELSDYARGFQLGYQKGAIDTKNDFERNQVNENKARKTHDQSK